MPLQLLSKSSYKRYNFFKLDGLLHKQVGRGFVEMFNTLLHICTVLVSRGFCPGGDRPGVSIPGFLSGVNVRESPIETYRFRWP